MLIPLAEVLAATAVSAGLPEVVHGAPEECMIRWVHSSEVFEMGPLLSGQELLLTTGLGLKGLSDRQLEGYVDALADAGLAALALELGRTFAEMPDALVRAARRRDLTLIALRQIVPFEAAIEGFHDLVMDREHTALRLSDRIWRELLDVVIDGSGLQALLQRVADLAKGDSHLLARDGRLIASSRPGTAPPAPTGDNSRSVVLDGALWGRLILDARRTQQRTAVLDRAARAVTLELLRTGAAQETAALASNLLRDVIDGRLPSLDELRFRLEIAGFPTEPGRRMIGLCVAGDRRIASQVLASAAHRACRETFGACLVGQVEDDVVVLTRVPRGGDPRLREELDRMCAALSEAIERTTGHVIVTLAAGFPVEELGGLAGTIAQSREVASIARRLGVRRRTLVARDLGVYRLLSRFGNEPELVDFVREQIGPLLDHDATYTTNLVQTLDTYLRHGLGKTETAAALGIRRQTLYNRLARIDAVLGRDALSLHESRTGLGLALHAWRLRTGLDPGGVTR